MTSQWTCDRAAEIVRFVEGEGKGALAAFVARQRWFAAKARGVGSIEVEDWAALEGARPIVLVLVRVDGERYYVPLAAVEGCAAGEQQVVVRRGALVIADAHAEPALVRELLAAISSGRPIDARAGRFLCHPIPGWSAPAPGTLQTTPVEQLGGEQSNTSLALGDLILKSFRRPQVGINPEVEVTAFLTGRTRFEHVPRLCGWIEYAGATGETAAVAVLQRRIPNVGDGWRYTLAALRHACGAIAAPAGPATRLESLTRDMRELGAVTGGLHAALASDASLPAFRPERMTDERARDWARRIVADVGRLVSDGSAAPGMPTDARARLADLVDAPGRAAEVVRALQRLTDSGTHVIRCHGDYHLGQVLKTPDSFAIIDFEGEPARPASERRAKQPPLRDVAGMFRSFDYAVHTVRSERDEWRAEPVGSRLERWEGEARTAFLDGYLDALAESAVPLVPATREDVLGACAVFELEKACYEVEYELNNRPDWVAIPLAGIMRILRPRA